MAIHGLPARAGGLVVAAALLGAPAARAQGSGDGFLFKPPTGSVGVRAGFDRPLASSDLYSFMTDELTLSRGDFGSLTLAADLSLRLDPRVDAVFSVAYAGSRTRSEFRRWVDQDNLPIEQTTTLERVPLTASVKWYVTPRGRSVGRFAWIPARYAPSVGAGGGAMWYRFRQSGDFIDFTNNNSVFSDDFTTDYWALTAHAFAGVDVSLSPRFVVTAEGRYTFAKAPLSNDFQGFDRIDLSGFSVTGGIAVRF